MVAIVTSIRLHAALAATLLLGSAAQAALVTTPGQVIGVTGGSFHRNMLFSFNPDGSISGSLPITPAFNIPDPNGYAGLAILGSDIHVLTHFGQVYRVDSATGAGTLLFSVSGAATWDALGNNGTNLVAYSLSNGAYREVTTAGTVVRSLTLPLGGGGIDVVGNEIFLGKYSSTGPGDVQVFSATSGAFLRTVQTNLPSASILALGYDAANNQFLIGSDDHLVRYSFAGSVATKLDDDQHALPVVGFPFPGQIELWGLDVMPGAATAAVPEPATITSFGLFALFMVCRSAASSSRRGKQSPDHAHTSARKTETAKGAPVH